MSDRLDACQDAVDKIGGRLDKLERRADGMTYRTPSGQRVNPGDQVTITGGKYKGETAVYEEAADSENGYYRLPSGQRIRVPVTQTTK